MGHADLSNLSEFFVKRLYAKGKLSVADCVEAMKKKRVKLQASEGAYEDHHMLCLGLEQFLQFLIEFNPPKPVLDRLANHENEATDGIYGPVVKPDKLSKRQEAVLRLWLLEGLDEPDDYEILDSIEWRFAPGWRNVYPHIPMLGRVTN